MPGQVLLSTILFTLALVFYTIGVWSERIAGRLKARLSHEFLINSKGLSLWTAPQMEFSSSMGRSLIPSPAGSLYCWW